MEEKKEAVQNEILGNEVTLSYLTKKYQLSDSEIMGIVYQLKQEGINISATKKGSEIYITSLGHNKLTDDSSYIIADNSSEIKFVLMSDLRYGSKYQQKSIINDVISKSHEFGAKYIFIAGDISEGIYSGAKQEIFNDSLFARDIEEQSKYIIENHPYVEGMQQYFITGEHDMTHLPKTYKDIGILVSHEREDMTYLGQYLKKVTFLSYSGNEINMLLQHSSGAVPYTVSYKPQQYAVSIRSEDKMDVLANGHWLTADRFRTRGIYVYSTPSLVATTPEMRKKGLNNVIGAWLITLTKDKKGNLKTVSQLFIPYYQTVENDYQKARTLRLGGNK